MSARVLIADDHPLTREGLAMAVRAALPGTAVDLVGTVSEAEKLAGSRNRYKLILLDLVLPDTRGFTGLLRLLFAFPSVPIMVITPHRSLELASTARSLGASGFVQKANSLEEVSTALRDIIGGKHVFPTETVANCATTSLQRRVATLSDAQQRVLFALADGRLNKQIAADLDITEATVKAHMTAILRKLGVCNRTQAILALQPLLGSVGEDTA